MALPRQSSCCPAAWTRAPASRLHARPVSTATPSRSSTASVTPSSSRPRAAVAHALGVAEHRLVDIDLRRLWRIGADRDIAVPKDRTRSRNRHWRSGDLRPGAQHRLPQLCARLRRGDRRARHLHRRQRARLLRLSRLPARRSSRRSRPTARLGTRLADLTIRAPLLHLTKAEIIAAAQSLGVDFGMTRSCYDPDEAGRACGRCDACLLRLQCLRGSRTRRSRALRDQVT